LCLPLPAEAELGFRPTRLGCRRSLVETGKFDGADVDLAEDGLVEAPFEVSSDAVGVGMLLEPGLAALFVEPDLGDHVAVDAVEPGLQGLNCFPPR